MDDELRGKLRGQGRILGLLHLVLAVLTALFGVVPLLYVAMGVAVIVARPASIPADAGDVAVGIIFIVMGSLVCLLIEALALLTALAGVALARAKRRTFILMVAVLLLLNQPLGTALGIFSLFWLFKADVQKLFEAQSTDTSMVT